MTKRSAAETKRLLEAVRAQTVAAAGPLPEWVESCPMKESVRSATKRSVPAKARSHDGRPVVYSRRST